MRDEVGIGKGDCIIKVQSWGSVDLLGVGCKKWRYLQNVFAAILLRCRIIFAERNEINAAVAETCSGPENRNASISLCKPLETRMIFSIVFEHLD